MCERNYTSKEVLLMTKVRKSNTKCYYCGCEVEEGKRTVDHLQPVSRGGLTVENNLVMACKDCNIEKDFLTEEEYKEVKTLVEKEIENSIGVKHLESLINIYSNILDQLKSKQKEQKDIEKEIASIQDIIMESRLSASDGYMLCKMLQDNLRKRNLVKKEIADLQRINDDIKSNYDSTKDKLNNIKNKIRNKCKSKYINNKNITLS